MHNGQVQQHDGSGSLSLSGTRPGDGDGGRCEGGLQHCDHAALPACCTDRSFPLRWMLLCGEQHGCRCRRTQLPLLPGHQHHRQSQWRQRRLGHGHSPEMWIRCPPRLHMQQYVISLSQITHKYLSLSLSLRRTSHTEHNIPRQQKRILSECCTYSTHLVPSSGVAKEILPSDYDLASIRGLHINCYIHSFLTLSSCSKSMAQNMTTKL